MGPETRHSPGQRRPVAAWVTFALLVLLLATPVLEARNPVGAVGLGALRTGAGLLALALRLLGWAAAEVLRFAPLGVLAALALAPPPPAASRLRRGGAAALALAVALAGTVAARALAARGPPLALGLLLPAAGATLGLAAALAWRGGPRARLRFAAGLGALCLGLGAGAAALGWLALEPEASLPAPAAVTSAEKLRLYGVLQGKNPRRIPPGQRRTLRLGPADLETALAWGSSAQRHGRGEVRLVGPDQVALSASLRIPRTGGRWLNVETLLRGRVVRGQVALEVPSLRVGRVRVPSLLLDLAAPAVVAAAAAEPRLAILLAAIDELSVDASGLTATYGRVDLPEGTLAGVVWGEDGVGVMRSALPAHVAHLLDRLAASPPGDARFAAGLEAAFGLARARTAAGEGPALEENRAALLALGIVLGHERLASVAGSPLEPAGAARARALRAAATARGRADWVRHFTVSAALTALASVSPADAAGLFKEEKDAGRGSGFSFADLLADRAGTRLAELALRDEATAAALQARLAGGAAVDDVFPPAADLPEGIPDAALQARYGGVGGPGFRGLAEEIERRIAACPVHRS